MSTPEKPAALPGALSAEVKAIDAIATGEPLPPGAPAAAPAPALEPVDYVAEAADLVEFAYANFVELYPSLEKIYTEPVRKKLAAKAGAVLKKRGWTLDRILDRWGAELGLLMAVQPLVVPTMKAIKADNAAARAAELEAQARLEAEKRGQGASPAAAGDVPPAPPFKMPE